MSRRQAQRVTFDAAKVRAQRQALALTNEDLAREVGVTLRTVQRWQLGESTPAGHQVMSLARALGIPPGDLYFTQAPAA